MNRNGILRAHQSPQVGEISYHGSGTRQGDLALLGECLIGFDGTAQFVVQGPPHTLFNAVAYDREGGRGHPGNDGEE